MDLPFPVQEWAMRRLMADLAVAMYGDPDNLGLNGLFRSYDALWPILSPGPFEAEDIGMVFVLDELRQTGDVVYVGGGKWGVTNDEHPSQADPRWKQIWRRFQQRLSAGDVSEIRKLYDQKVSLKELSQRYGRSTATIRQVVYGDTYQDLPLGEAGKQERAKCFRANQYPF